MTDDGFTHQELDQVHQFLRREAERNVIRHERKLLLLARGDVFRRNGARASRRLLQCHRVAVGYDEPGIQFAILRLDQPWLVAGGDDRAGIQDGIEDALTPEFGARGGEVRADVAATVGNLIDVPLNPAW